MVGRRYIGREGEREGKQKGEGGGKKGAQANVSHVFKDNFRPFTDIMLQ